jgi:glutathione S-transferase
VAASGPFFLGPNPSLVDAVIAPWLLRNNVLEHWRGVNILADHPRLSAYTEHLK